MKGEEFNFELNQESKNNIAKKVGVPFENIIRMSCDDIDKKIEEKMGKKLEMDYNCDNRLTGRGSVYISLMRYINPKYLIKKMSKI